MMIPTLSSSKVLLISFPWRSRPNPNPHFSVCCNSSIPIAQSIDVAKEIDYKSFTVSYLINSCGLSPESAEVASNYAQIKTASNPDSVLACLRNYGFSDADINQVVKRFPCVLKMRAERNLKPKMEFFLSIGVKGEEIPRIIYANPSLLGSSLYKKIIPCYEFLKRVLVHDELVVKSLKTNSWMWQQNLEKRVIPNIEFLKEIGVPESKLPFVLIYLSYLLCFDNAKFKEKVDRVISMGFDPSRTLFVQALRYSPKIATWERKAQIFRSWGWSDSDISLAYRSESKFKPVSAEKLTAMKELLLNKMGWDSSDLVAAPYVFNRSLKDVTQRCSVIRVLVLKGSIEEKPALHTVASAIKKRFLEKFVFSYLEQVPELLDIYEGKVGLLELGYGFEEKLVIKLQ